MTEALDSIILRLEKLMSHYELSASGFAERIGVQRSSISHLLSGRNKPSLEFVLKVISSFPEIQLEWLLLGNGDFISVGEETLTQENDPHSQQQEIERNAPDILSPLKPDKVAAPNLGEVALERIVLFYSNGTFSTYRPENTNQ